MNALGSLTTANLLLNASRGVPRAPAAPQLLAVSGGVSTGTLSAAGASDSIYSVNHVDATKLRVKLVERLAKAFDFSLDDFSGPGAMAQAIKTIVAKMPPAAIVEVEKSLGLDKLGVSLNELLDALIDPGGNAEKKLMGALREAAGELFDKDGDAASAPHSLGLDEVGRYSPATAAR